MFVIDLRGRELLAVYDLVKNYKYFCPTLLSLAVSLSPCLFLGLSKLVQLPGPVSEQSLQFPL